MEWLVIVTLILIGLTWLYTRQMQSLISAARHEGFRGTGAAKPTIEGVSDDALATFGQGLPLSDVLTPEPRLKHLTARGVADEDQARQLELGGQYVQRTNNYRHDYPDNGSTPLSEMVGAVYKPHRPINTTVPCPGSC